MAVLPTTEIINRTTDHVRAVLSGEGSGHDWWHIERVWRMARRIGQAEGVDLLVVELAALLHDIADWKAHGGDLAAGPKKAGEWLNTLHIEPAIVERVCQIIGNMSFKGAKVAEAVLSPEGQVVQDADRLDAIGAIGIARAFAYGGSRGRLLYDPACKPIDHDSAEAYLNNKGTTVNHFYEKLLLLKDRMNTPTGRAIAEERHRFMEDYLRQFYQEWEGVA
jgi:uncharacterized protein